jgi:hypothetical protein
MTYTLWKDTDAQACGTKITNTTGASVSNSNRIFPLVISLLKSPRMGIKIVHDGAKIVMISSMGLMISMTIRRMDAVSWKLRVKISVLFQ